MRLTKQNLVAFRENESVSVPDDALFDLPEKVLQFGTGVLLRGLPDYLVDKANRQGIFNGRIVVVKSTDSGDSTIFDEQDNLYTLCIRGVEDKKLIEENVICSAISRVLSAKSQWQEVLACAKNAELEIIISNTTEVGIQLVQDDILRDTPVSFPGKLLAFLYARYEAFKGDKSKGLVIIPTELIPDNGKKLESILLELAHLNNLETSFVDWLENYNTFCNSLVDRIVPGKPTSEAKKNLTEQLGYEDGLITMSEVYLLWAIEGDENVRNKLSFYQVDSGVFIEPNIDQFRELKLRMLNGTHTLSCGLAYLSGFRTVKEAMQNENMAAYISNLMLSDIALGIPYPIDSKIAQRFGCQVLDRFRNPFIEHQWLNITMNYTSKMYMRNIPTLLHYSQTFHTIPKYYALGFAAYLLFMRVVKEENGVYYGQNNGEFYVIQDENAAYFHELWQNYSPEELVKIVLKKENIWQNNLNKLDSFADKIIEYLTEMLESGVANTLSVFFSKRNLNLIEA